MESLPPPKHAWQGHLLSILPEHGFCVKFIPRQNLSKFPGGIAALWIEIVVLALSPNSLEIQTIEIEMNKAGIGNGFRKGRREVKSEIRLRQPFSSPMTIARRVMTLAE